MDLLFPADELDAARCLELVIEGETYEYTEMYPKFSQLAEQEQKSDALREFDEQIEESRQHATQFRQTLEKARKRFAALTRVEERHARRYQDAPAKVSA
jgi:rubrerythrin